MRRILAASLVTIGAMGWLLFAASLNLIICAWESYVAMHVWAWHVSPLPSGFTLWGVTWANVALSVIFRMRRDAKEESITDTIVNGFIGYGLFVPASALAIAWLLT